MRDTSEGTVIWSCVINEWAFGSLCRRRRVIFKDTPEQHPKHEAMRLYSRGEYRNDAHCMSRRRNTLMLHRFPSGSGTDWSFIGCWEGSSKRRGPSPLTPNWEGKSRRPPLR